MGLPKLQSVGPERLASRRDSRFSIAERNRLYVMGRLGAEAVRKGCLEWVKSEERWDGEWGGEMAKVGWAFWG